MQVAKSQNTPNPIPVPEKEVDFGQLGRIASYIFLEIPEAVHDYALRRYLDGGLSFMEEHIERLAEERRRIGSLTVAVEYAN